MTLDWSYELLTPSRRRVFAQLAVFVGGCSLEAAEAVCDSGEGSVLDDVAGIVEESLARRERAPNPRVLMFSKQSVSTRSSTSVRSQRKRM